MLPSERSLLERFQLASDAGFSGVEMRTPLDLTGAEQAREAAERSGLRIHAVVDAGHRRCPLSSPERDVVRQGVAMVRESLRTARFWGADAVLIAPSAAGPQTSYRDAWTRSQTVIREQILPVAGDLEVVIAVEDVWDGFVTGPSELGRYVDALDSRWVKASVDLDRLAFYSSPRDCVRALGPRLVNVRARDMHLAGTMRKIGYDGWFTTGA